MESSQSLISALQIKTESRDRLYWGQYRWCVDFSMPDARLLKSRINDFEEYKIALVNKWKYRKAARIHLSQHRVTLNQLGSWAPGLNEAESSRQLNEILQLGTFLWNHPQVKPMFYYGWIYLYTNDLDALIENIDPIRNARSINIRQCVIDRPLNTLMRRDPQYQQRTYMHNRLVSSTQRESLASMLFCQTDVRISPVFLAWLKESQYQKSWCSSHYWIDHNDDGIKLMIEMIVPRLIGRTMQIMDINTEITGNTNG